MTIQARIKSHRYALYRTKRAILKTMPSFDTSDIDQVICDLQENSLNLIGATGRRRKPEQARTDASAPAIASTRQSCSNSILRTF